MKRPYTPQSIDIADIVRFLTLATYLVIGSPAVADEVSFTRDIRPILSDRCFACHGPDENDRQASLRLDIADGPEGAYRSEANVTAVSPGSLDESELWSRITSEDEDLVMPPSDAHKPAISAEEQQLIREWIEQGAEYESFWAFVPPKIARPKVQDTAWSEQSIDLYVREQLESLGLSPSDEAEKRLLIRRLAFDLTGLPPTREEVHAFLSSQDADAYEKLVDELLGRRQYGEHMARYWLDLVRFADTNGMHKDFYRNFIAYRDWVIRAFNDNLSYDEFVRYQLAGDLFDEPTRDQLVASGFNRLHLIIDRGTALPEESFFKNVLDRVSATGTVFMGMTVQCAQCHDHKYDPITQKDYYSLFAFFNNLDAAPETVRAPPGGLQPPFISLASDQQQKNFDVFGLAIDAIAKEVASLETRITSEEDATLKAALSKELESLKADQKEAEKRIEELDKTIPKAMVMKERADVRQTFVMTRGQYDAPGEAVERNTPAFLPDMEQTSEIATRMDLANWLVEPSNPLTARVMVNRVWQQFFGVGIVKTSEDLGAQGDVPSHPELLDYLATTFIESGWDIKRLVKEIVMSRTYRQSSKATPEAFKQDPENRLLSRGSRFRLDAEMIRDQILATSGLLSKKMYGKSVKPPQPAGLWKAVTMTNEVFKPDAGDDTYRRSLYTYWKRAMPPPQMTIFNAPNRDACIARRERTNTPSQALLLLNESEYLKAAQRLAIRVLDKSDLNSSERIEMAYEIVTSRIPDRQEKKILLQLAQDLEQQYSDSPELVAAICPDLYDPTERTEAEDSAQDSNVRPQELAAWTVLVNTLYNLDITKNRE